jgi:hypothetical protein
MEHLQQVAHGDRAVAAPAQGLLVGGDGGSGALEPPVGIAELMGRPKAGAAAAERLFQHIAAAGVIALHQQSVAEQVEEFGLLRRRLQQPQEGALQQGPVLLGEGRSGLLPPDLAWIDLSHGRLPR